jgi:hypothetical protein
MSKESTDLANLWRKHLAERLSTGIPVKQWCKDNGYTKHQYYYWNRKINMSKDSPEVSFADVTEKSLTKEIMHTSPDFTIRHKDLVITIPDGFNPSSLAELLKVLREK